MKASTRAKLNARALKALARRAPAQVAAPEPTETPKEPHTEKPHPRLDRRAGMFLSAVLGLALSAPVPDET